MARTRNWIDYANLAANAAQVAQLETINRKMRQLAELENERIAREHEEAAQKRFEASVREAVFVYGEQLRDVEEVAQTNPVAAYIRASHLKQTYAAIPQFSSSNLRDFEDKQRLASVQRACDQLIDASAKRLRPDEREDSDLCLKYIFERADMIQLISVQEKREKLSAKKASVAKKVAPKLAALQKIQDEKASLVPPRWIGLCDRWVAPVGVVLLLLLVAGILMLVFGSGGDPEQFMSGKFMPKFATGFGVLSAIVIGLMILRTGNSYTSRLEVLNRDATALEENIAALNEEIASSQAEINPYVHLYAKFGESTLDGYHEQLRKRDALMKRLLGTFVKGLMGEKYYNSLGER